MMNEGKTENLKPNSRLSTPLLLLCIFLLIVQIANGLYFARCVEHSELFDFMYLLVFFWLVGWWMKEDSKRYGIH